MKLILRGIALIAGIAILGLVMAWLAGFFSETIEPGSVAPPIPVNVEETFDTAIITEQSIEQSPGTLRAKEETSISSRIVSTITSLNVRAGDSVVKGQVLANLDDRDLQARVAQTRQALTAVEAQLANAEAEYERIREQFESGVSARAALDRAEAELSSLRADRDRAFQAIEEADAALSYATITSPIDGRVIDRYAEPGDTVSPGQPIVRLYDPQSIRLEADVRESLATTLKRGDELKARIDALDQEFSVVVDEIVPQSDTGARSFLVKTTLPPMENAYPGMFGRLMIPAGDVERIYIPEKFVSRVGQLEYVLVIDQGKPVRRFIRTGIRGGEGSLEVLSGLSAGESIAR